MDAAQLRKVADEARAKLSDGQEFTQDHVVAAPSPDGHGYLVETRGLIIFGRTLPAAVQIIMRELRAVPSD